MKSVVGGAQDPVRGELAHASHPSVNDGAQVDGVVAQAMTSPMNGTIQTLGVRVFGIMTCHEVLARLVRSAMVMVMIMKMQYIQKMTA